MKILAIETSTLTGSVALLVAEGDDLRLKGEILLSVSLQHSEKLLPAIQRLFEDSGETINSIDLFAVAKGPGSFTGLRIGLSSAQGLALAAGRPVIGVSTLEALALNVCSDQKIVVPILDARRGEIYAAAYKDGSELLSERAIAPTDWVKELSRLEGEFLCLGNGARVYRDLLRQSLKVSFPPPTLMEPRASQVGVLAFRQFSKNNKIFQAVPSYLRPAETTFPKRFSGLDTPGQSDQNKNLL